MTLVDTSVWVNHFRRPHSTLIKLLEDSSAGMHPFVLGELACGNLKDRALTLGDLARMPEAPLATQEEVLHLLQSRRLWGEGLGWVDVHILASALLGGWDLLTADRAMERAARRLGILWGR
jgi:predicted nucleic acid-binding protein